MCKRLCNFLHQNNILYEFQFGFRKQHSTILALMEVMDSIYSHLDNHDFILGFFLTYKKHLIQLITRFYYINWTTNGLEE